MNWKRNFFVAAAAFTTTANAQSYTTTLGELVTNGGTWSDGTYIPTESDYKYGGYYIDDNYDKHVPRGSFDSNGDWIPESYGLYGYQDDYYDPNGKKILSTMESGECGEYNTVTSEFQQSIQKCLNKADRFEDQAKEYLERLKKEVKENPNCKYIQALIDEDDANVAQEFKDLYDQFNNVSEPVDALELLQNVTEQSYLNVCAELAELQSCVVDGLLPIISEAIDIVEKDQCCTEFVDRISIKGYSIVERIEMLVNQIPNLFCLNRISDTSVPKEQNCGYTIVQSMFPPVYDVILANLKVLVQIPNDQACKAFNGEVYTNTNGKKEFLTINLPIGSCSSAFDTIFSTAKAFLIDDGENSLYDLAIDSGMFRRRDLDELEKQIGPLKALFDDESCANVELPEGYGDICINFPTEFTRECYPGLAAKGVYGGPMEGLFGGSTPGEDDGGNTGIAGQSTSIAVTLVAVVSMMCMTTSWM